ncbi:hypothetical protein GCM10010169_63780 [Micromonospora fulviviridis]|uniref:hypothetical protein n=1 Tax=Micromonospora fulviviridis TaxID=47860 RepID=UPI00166DB12B|nr:hypothetical protein [Micromonospora fulviviridis]GGS10241.1 hypothetical protein GCM10010169_63780 [Micromonospora fulviviridis]
MRKVTARLAAVLILGAMAAACTTEEPAAPVTAQEVPQPAVSARGDTMDVTVAPADALDVAVPGVGRLQGAAGSFTKAGTVRISSLRSDQPRNDFVVTSDVGLDVSFVGTSLARPLRVIFDDPRAAGLVPGGAVPVALHRPDSGVWEVRPMSRAADGALVLETQDFSPNLLGWVPIPDWLRSVGDSFADFVTQRTDPRHCPKPAAPPWSSVVKGTTLVHLCSITNSDSAGVPRAEVQVQSNRRFLTWVQVPAGRDYVWVDGQPDALRRVLNGALRHDMDQVLLPGNGWFTAGYRQPSAAEQKQFNAYIDGYSAGLTVALNLLGVSFGEGVYGAVVIMRKCVASLLPMPTWEGGKEFIACLVQQTLSNLVDPGKAYAAAMDLYGESAYAKSAETTIMKSMERLRIFGKLMRILGVAGVISATFPQLPDLFSDWGKDYPGRFTLKLAAKPVTPTVPGPTTPGPRPSNSGPGMPPLNPRIDLSRGGAAPHGSWYSVVLSGFAPGSSVTVACRDSVDPGGFFNQTFTIGGDGRAADSTLCYSADGPDHWVTSGSVASNRVSWGGAPPPPPPAPARIDLSRGGAAPHGSWYSVVLSGFAPGSSVTVTCRDSVDPGGFFNQTFTIGGDGRAADSTLCYSADGPDHWVTGGNAESNHVPW